MRSRLIAVLLAAITVAACGGSNRPAAHHPARSLAVSHCQPHNWSIQCNFPRGLRQPPSVQAIAASGRGIDFSWGAPDAGAARQAGLTFAVSYLSWSTKDWTVSSLSAYRAAGVARVLNWEQGGTQAANGCDQGRRDALAASSEAGALGYPRAVIYFSVDFDASTSQVLPYFVCASRAIGLDRVGVYAGVRVVDGLFAAHAVAYGWQTLAWSGGQVSPRACLYQNNVNVPFAGHVVDTDLSFCRNYGQLDYVQPPPPPPPDPHAYLLSPTGLKWLPGGMRGGPFHSPFGLLDERGVRVQAGGAAQHLGRYRDYFKHVLDPRLRFLAARITALACSARRAGFLIPCDWHTLHYGTRRALIVHEER